MRSKEDGFDCSAFAKQNNGGGHKAAAGFNIEYNCFDPIDKFLKILLQFLVLSFMALIQAKKKSHSSRKRKKIQS